MNKSTSKTEESKYIQQHLANERTYLAWLRTALSFIGVGFLVTTLHFSVPTLNGDTFAKVIGYSTILLGVLTIFFATVNYLKKRKTITDQTFTSPKIFIIFLSSFAILITFFFSVYFFFLWG